MTDQRSGKPAIGENPGPDQRSLELLRRVSYLSDLGGPALAALAAVATPRRYPAGRLIMLQDEPAAGLFLVADGIVKISRLSSEGREQILHLIHPANTFNDVAALDGGPNPAMATAHTDAVVWHISRSDLQAVAEGHPAIAWALAGSIASRARHLVRIVEDLAMHSVRARLARLLLEQGEGQESAAVERLMTQEEMAQRLGTVREMVGRVLKSLAAAGIVEFDRHRIVILDRSRLEEEAEL
jgi:CRP/FNR family transcriptional regulator